jgi:hypothetical protein
MHDPMTVAFTIRYPWRDAPTKHFPAGYRHTFITVWHVDPEKRGNDDSCDWFGSHRKLNQRERELWHALDDLFHTLGNRPYWPDPKLYGSEYLEIRGDDTGVVGQAQRAVARWKERGRFRWHPRWHFWHWSFQVHPLQAFKRWAFTRCAVCGGRFAWGQSGTGTWSGTGPLWFRSERLTHMGCSHGATKRPEMASALAVDPSRSTPDRTKQ